MFANHCCNSVCRTDRHVYIRAGPACSNGSEFVRHIAIQISVQGSEGSFFFFLFSIINIVSLSVRSHRTELEGVMVEIYPNKNGMLLQEHGVSVDAACCTARLHTPPDDDMNTDTMLLSFPTCLGLPQLTKCSNNCYIGLSQWQKWEVRSSEWADVSGKCVFPSFTLDYTMTHWI